MFEIDWLAETYPTALTVEAFPEAVYISLEPDLRLDPFDPPPASHEER